MPDQARMVYDATDANLRFVWHGGEYIEYGLLPQEGDVIGELDPPQDVLNVWDYERSEPTIPATLAGFQARCEEAIAGILADADEDE